MVLLSSSGRKVDRNGRECEIVVDACIAVAGNGVVTVHTFELIECASTTSVRAAAAKADRRVRIVELRTANQLDRSQCIRANGRIAGHRARGKIDGDASRNHARIEEVSSS